MKILYVFFYLVFWKESNILHLMFLSVDITVLLISFTVCQQLKEAAPQIQDKEIQDTWQATDSYIRCIQ